MFSCLEVIWTRIYLSSARFKDCAPYYTILNRNGKETEIREQKSLLMKRGEAAVQLDVLSGIIENLTLMVEQESTLTVLLKVLRRKELENFTYVAEVDL